MNYPRIAYSLLALSLATLPAAGADQSWKGLGGDNLWSNSLNWSALPSTAGVDGLIFEGTTQTAAKNDFSGATFNKITFSAGAGAFVLSGSSINLAGNITNNSTSLQTIGLDLVLTAARTVSTAAGNITINGNISGDYGLTKSSAGTLTLSGSNSFINLLVGSTGGAIKLAGAYASGNGYVDLRGTSSVTFGANVGTFVFHGLGNDIGTASVSPFALMDDAGKAVTLKVLGTSNYYHSGVLSGSGSLVIELGAGGRQRLGGTQTYTGGTVINSGVLEITGASGNLPNGGALTMNGGTLDIVRAGAKTVTLSALNGSGTILGNATGDATLVVNTAQTNLFSGTLKDDTGTIRLTKSGTGSLTLSGSNAYTGVTTVSGGLLRIDGSLNGTNVTVQSGAALGGHGGKITGGAVTLNSGSAFDFALTDPSVVGLTVSSVTLGSNIGLRLSLTSALLSNGDFKLIEGYAGGTFASINGVAFGADNTFQLQFGGVDYDFQLVYGPSSVHALALNVIPEPGAYALMLGGIGLLGGLAFRRKVN